MSELQLLQRLSDGFAVSAGNWEADMGRKFLLQREDYNESSR
jgi:hypothetical protein